MSILSLLQHSKRPTDLKNLPEGFYTDLTKALKAKNLHNVREHLGKIPRTEYYEPQIVGCFLTHFCEETMGVLFDNMVGSREFWAILNATEVASEDVWMWLIAQRELPVAYLVNDVIERLNSSRLTQQQQQSVVHFFTASSPEIDVDDFLFNTGHTLKTSQVDEWAECIWVHLRTFSKNDWSNMIETVGMDDLLCIKNHSSYIYLTKSLQNIPHFQQAFDQHFENITQQYIEFVENFTSPKGVMHSSGFKKLPRDVKNLLRNHTCYLYDSDNGLLIGKYKHILGYTNDELFLKNFGFDELDIECDTPQGQFLANGLQPLHPLHIILQQPEGFLQFDHHITPLIAQHLDHPVILQNVFDNMEPADFDNILQQHPQLAQWKDAKGNSLAHWCVVNKPFNANWTEVMARYPSLLEPNLQGFTLRDIILIDIEIGTVEEEDLAPLDHILISQALANPTATTQRVRKI